jgi:hypothetical protein
VRLGAAAAILTVLTALSQGRPGSAFGHVSVREDASPPAVEARAAGDRERSTGAGQAGSGRREGRVTLAGRALADEGGPFLGLGVTLFWALWGEAHDPDRLDANLSWLAARGVDYVRILGMVGGESWSDRRIDPSADEYWPTVDRFLERLARHRLRAQVTLFAEADTMMPPRADRAAFVDRWAARLEQEPSRFVLVEVANEHYQNGLPEPAELRALGARLGERTDVLVALSAPSRGAACAVYAGSAADVATIHYSRDVGDGNPWLAVAEPWSYPADYDGRCRGRLPVAVNNEPIGPASSVAEDADPLRLVLSYVTTFLAQNAAYVLHVGAGIRGGGERDRARGRLANLFDVTGLDETLEGIRAAKGYLPLDLPNWTRVDARDDRFPLEGLRAGVDRDDLHRAYAALSGDRFVLVVLGLNRSIEVTSRVDVDLQVIEPDSGRVVRRLALRAGAPLVLEPRDGVEAGDGLVVIGGEPG